jgi:ABC-type transport system involved in multi-copper enzyme maturation permease subunit
MKYGAILKDSLREALDSKVLYVSLGLSCILIAVVACVSFQPVPADEALKHIAERASNTRVRRDRGRNVFERTMIVPGQFGISDIQALTETSEPQMADYRFKLRIQETAPDEFKRAVFVWDSTTNVEIPTVGQPVDVSQSLIEQFIKDRFSRVGNVQVVKIERAGVKSLAPPGSPLQMHEYSYTVETKGTRSIRGWLHDPHFLFGAIPLNFMRTTLGRLVFMIEAIAVNTVGAWIGIMLGVVITAFFIPNMLRKGTIDLLLAKPVRRSTLLIYKYVGGLTFMLLNALFAVGGMWLVLGMRSGIWAYEFLLSILVLTFYFAVLYSVSTLAAVLSRSAIVAILATCLAWFVLYLVGSGYSGLNALREEPEAKDWVPGWVYRTVNTAHYVLPRTKDLDYLMNILLSKADLTEAEREVMLAPLPKSMNWGESLAVCALFIAVMLGLSCIKFARQDY